LRSTNPTEAIKRKYAGVYATVEAVADDLKQGCEICEHPACYGLRFDPPYSPGLHYFCRGCGEIIFALVVN
jgi:hypothetical protein